MAPEPLTIVLEQPFDWVGSVLVPLGAIAVSTFIALRVSRSERLAAEKAEKKRAVARLLSALRSLSDACIDGTDVGVSTAGRRVFEQVDAVGLWHSEDDQPVLKYVAAVLHTPAMAGDFAALNVVARSLVIALDAWAAGRLPASEFEKAMPPHADDVWSSTIDLSAWPKWHQGIETFEDNK